MQEHLSDLSVAGIFAGFGALCGGLAYGTAVLEGKQFSLGALLLNLSISACCSFFVGEACLAYDVPLRATLAISGMGGWMGPHLPSLIQTVVTKLVLRRAGVAVDKESEK